MRPALLLFLLFTVACNRAESVPAAAAPAGGAGDAERGRHLVAQYGCNVCHVIPGTEGPQGSMGPSLAGLASRPAISGGQVANTPANLVQFIQNPSSLNPATTMPPLALGGNDPQDIAAFLLTLR